MRITEQQVEAACAVASKVYDRKLSPEAGATQLQKDHGLNINSARDYINDYRHLLRGEEFQRAMSAPAMDYFLSSISAERGTGALTRALAALRLHIAYYEGIRKVKLHSLRYVLARYEAALAHRGTVASEEEAFAEAVQRSLKDTPERRRRRLAVAPTRPIRITAPCQIFLRNADVVAEVMLQAKGICGGCGQKAPFLRKSDNTPYLEVHHKKPLAQGGEDTVANAIALCPNCHRRRHFGHEV